MIKLTPKIRSPSNSFFERATNALECRLGIHEADLIIRDIYQHTEKQSMNELRLICEAYGILI